jgi:hypothetical protein
MRSPEPEETMNPNQTMRLVAAATTAALLAMPPARAEDKAYTQGHVWTITMVKVKYGMRDTYLNEVLPLRKKIQEEAKKEGLLISSHTLVGDPANQGDFDVMFLEEHTNWATFDGFDAKMEAIEEKIVGSQDKQNQMLAKRVEVREVLGEKAMQELIAK